jgi:hypothetical protein
MGSRVLIVGNGVSRLAYESYIVGFAGEVWACNRAYQEFPDKIARLTGHREPMLEAQAWKERHGYKYQIFAGPLSRLHPEWLPLTCAPKWHRDSGTTLVAEALTQGFQVEAVGFDMGGPDVYWPDAYQTDKTAWVRRWCEIIEEWGERRVNFIGHDHKPFLRDAAMHKAKAGRYAAKYKARRPHIPGEEYRKIYEGYFMSEKKTEEKRVRVRWPNGYVASYRESLASIYLDRGEVELFPEAIEDIAAASSSGKKKATK